MEPIKWFYRVDDPQMVESFCKGAKKQMKGGNVQMSKASFQIK